MVGFLVRWLSTINMHTIKSIDWDIDGKRAQREIPPHSSGLDNPKSPKVLKVVSKDWLTPAQLEVVRLLSVGKLGKETAHILGISEGTLRAHMSQARGRTGCKTTAQLIAEYVRRVEMFERGKL